MYFRLQLFVILGLAPFAGKAEEQLAEAHFLAVPNTCVALREGRPCYSKVELIWQASVPGNLCIRKAGAQQALSCWQQANQGRYLYDFASSENESFELFSRDNAKVLALTQIQVQWVYTTKKNKRRWRLF